MMGLDMNEMATWIACLLVAFLAFAFAFAISSSICGMIADFVYPAHLSSSESPRKVLAVIPWAVSIGFSVAGVLIVRLWLESRHG